MTVPLQEIYEALDNRMKSVDGGKLWFDLDVGQLDSDGIDLPLRFPAVLVKFADIIWKQRDQQVDIGLVNVTVKFVYQFQKEKELMSGNSSRGEVDNCLSILHDITNQLSKQHGSTFSELRLVNQFQEKSHPNKMLWIHMLQFQCNIQSDDNISNPNDLYVDYDDIRNNNSFLERRRFNLLF